MADLIARRDPETGYVYFSAADDYPIPDDVWQWLRMPPYRGEYSAAHKGELRLTRAAGHEAVTALRDGGHIVTAFEAARNERARQVAPTLDATAYLQTVWAADQAQAAEQAEQDTTASQTARTWAARIRQQLQQPTESAEPAGGSSDGR